MDELPVSGTTEAEQAEVAADLEEASTQAAESPAVAAAADGMSAELDEAPSPGYVPL